MTNWKPISEAPRDGPYVLAASHLREKYYVYWDKDPDCQCWYDKEGREYPDNFFQYFLDYIPPLPEKPKQPESFREHCEGEEFGFEALEAKIFDPELKAIYTSIKLLAEYMDLRLNNRGE